ncbi:hypothetical protein LENED_009601 [Lentinula edodes]|uniref:Uncharacterized protein n=1 Tax=Lentinula edodes TaxID=5353 RepID=A0A1Q3EK88_LENED|nr:hypothetical protein LENED_009601 [Lentinula edodes]
MTRYKCKTISSSIFQSTCGSLCIIGIAFIGSGFNQSSHLAMNLRPSRFSESQNSCPIVHSECHCSTPLDLARFPRMKFQQQRTVGPRCPYYPSIISTMAFVTFNGLF